MELRVLARYDAKINEKQTPLALVFLTFGLVSVFCISRQDAIQFSL